MATNRNAVTTDLIARVTDAQLDRCFRFEAEENGHRETRYAVRSESDPDTEYTVRFIPGKGFTCTCPAGVQGFHYCSKGVCKHCIWSVAHARRFREEAARLEKQERLMAMGLTLGEAKEALAATLIVDGREADLETLARVFGPRQQRPSEREMNRMAKACNPRPFAICR